MKKKKEKKDERRRRKKEKRRIGRIPSSFSILIVLEIAD